ncbi:MAG: hypothetical protein M0C28_39995 [Candidatus Moduliflexus flocculans]|nr:hypothetical protein [Candidatus Moduliflexus flocculans]
MLETMRPKLDLLSRPFLGSDRFGSRGRPGKERVSSPERRGDAPPGGRGMSPPGSDRLVQAEPRRSVAQDRACGAINVYDRGGALTMALEGDAVYFDPGSGALEDPGSGDIGRTEAGDQGSRPFRDPDRRSSEHRRAEHGHDLHGRARSHAGQVSALHRAEVLH